MADAKAGTSLNKREHCDVAVIGGGLAGSLSAIHLARAGFKVVLFEKEARPLQKVCGEFLSYESIPLLREVGIDPHRLGGVDITEFRLHGPRYSTELKLPRRAVSLPRLKLDEALLEKAMEAGADIRRGVRVADILEGLDETTGSILISTTEGEIRAQRLVVATGKTEFKILGERTGRDNSYVGFKVHLKMKPSCAAILKNHCDLFVFESGYGGLTDLGNEFANLAFLVEKSALARIGSDWDSISAHIGRSCWRASHYLDGAVPQSALASVSTVPYGFLRRTPPPAGVFFVGDQMAVIPSMTGEGMTIALMTARLAVEAMMEPAVGGARLRFAPTASRNYQREVRAVLRPQIDSALALQAFFKKPRVVDVSTFALGAFPALFRRAFQSTRCKLIESHVVPNRGTTLKKSPATQLASPVVLV